jgi:hypothetical protein
MKTNVLPENLNNFVSILQNFLNDYDLSNMETIFYVDKHVLNEINSKLYYEINANAAPEETDEIIININDYKFIYRLKEK